MTSGAGRGGRGRPSGRQDAGADVPIFDDARDSDVARLWLDLAGMEEEVAASDADKPAPAPPAPVDLGALLTRASDLPAPPRRPRDAEDTGTSGPTPLPWTTTATDDGSAAPGGERRGRRGRGARSGGSGQGGRGTDRRPRSGADVAGSSDSRARRTPDTPAAPEEPAARVIGGGGREEPAEGARRRRGRRPGPAPLPEDPREREEAAREVVLRQLAMGPRSRGQLERKLAERQAEPELVDRVLDRFEEVSLVDDAAFAEVWVRSRARGKRLSRRAISRELHEKGVDRDVAEEALAAIEPEDERQAALELVRAKMRGRPAPAADGPEGRAERDKVVRRLVGMLGRKGYGPGLAFGVVKEVLAELDG